MRFNDPPQSRATEGECFESPLRSRPCSVQHPRQGEGGDCEQDRDDHREPVQVPLGHGGTAQAPQRPHAAAESIGEPAAFAGVEEDQADQRERHDQMDGDEDGCDHVGEPFVAPARSRGGPNPQKYGATPGAWQVSLEVRPPLGLGGLSLSGDGCSRGSDGLRITQVVRFDRPKRVVQFVDERDAGGDVEGRYVFVGHAVQMLHQRTQAVAVSRDERGPTGDEVRHDRIVPIRKHSNDDVGKALRRR